MKKVFNKKILFIFALFIFFILINCSSVYASGVTVTDGKYTADYITSVLELNQNPFEAFGKVIDYYNETSPNAITCNSEDLLELQHAVLITYYMPEEEPSYRYEFFFCDKPFYMKNVSSSTSNLTARIPEPEGDAYGTAHYSIFRATFGSGIEFDSGGIELSGGGATGTGYDTIYFVNDYVSGVESYSITASTFDILDKQGGLVVFQQPTLGKVTTLAPVIQTQKREGTLQVVLTEIIQILPLILVVVVSLIGLRKVLKMLSQLLHRS